MCLIYDHDCTELLRREMIDAGGIIHFTKILKFYGAQERIASPYIPVQFPTMGVMVSNRDPVELQEKEMSGTKMISRGIHVFNRPKSHWCNSFALWPNIELPDFTFDVEAEAHVDDLIAINSYYTEAVFHIITITKSSLIEGLSNAFKFLGIKTHRDNATIIKSIVNKYFPDPQETVEETSPEAIEEELELVPV